MDARGSERDSPKSSIGGLNQWSNFVGTGSRMRTQPREPPPVLYENSEDENISYATFSLCESKSGVLEEEESKFAEESSRPELRKRNGLASKSSLGMLRDGHYLNDEQEES